MQQLEGSGTDAPSSVTLRQGTLPLAAIIGQSVSGMGMSAIVALVIPLVAITAGSGGWLTWVICTGVIIPVAYCICRLARRVTTTGGLYGLAAATLGSFGGVVTGWVMLLLIGVAGIGTTIGFGIYFAQFLTLFGLPDNHVVQAVAYVACLGAAWQAAYAGVERAAQIMLAVEVVATVSIVVLLVAVLATHHGSLVDPTQLHLRGTSLSKVLQGAVLGILSFGGFETATIFGQEARNPVRAIPVAMMASVVFAGVLWTVAGYTLYLGFQDSAFNLAHSSQPLHDLAKIAHIGWFSYIIDFSISITLYSSMIAVFNGISRLMFTGAREGLGPPYWGRLHQRRHTPTAAINTMGGVFILAIIGIVVSRADPFDMFGDFGNLSGVGYIALYGLICVGSVVFFARRRKTRPVHVALAGGAVVALGYVFYSNVYPWPGFPDNLTLAISIAVVVGSVLRWVMLRARHPQRLAKFGSTTVTVGEPSR